MHRYVSLSMFLIVGAIAQSLTSTPTQPPLTVVTPPFSPSHDGELQLTTLGYICVPTESYLSGQPAPEATLASISATYNTASFYSVGVVSSDIGGPCDSNRFGKPCETSESILTSTTPALPRITNATFTTSEDFQIVPTLATTFTGGANLHIVSNVGVLVLGAMAMAW